MKLNKIPEINSIYNENEVINDFLIENSELHKNIGKLIKFKNWNKRMGTIAKTDTFKIMGVQKIYDGTLAYRVYSQNYNDTFGRPARPEEIKFVLNVTK